jgi:hypothetical protein
VVPLRVGAVIFRPGRGGQGIEDRADHRGTFRGQVAMPLSLS